jgi:hypothetical protein
MRTELWALRWRCHDGTYGVGIAELQIGTTLEDATEWAFRLLVDEGSTLESITNTATGERGELGFAAANAPELG